MAEDKELELDLADPFVVKKNEEPVAVVAPVTGHEREIQDALWGVGYEVERAPVEDGGEPVELEACEVDNPRPCELTVALGMAQELGREAGVPTTEVDALAERGYATEAEARRAVEAVVARLPDDMKLQGQALIDATWGDGSSSQAGEAVSA